MDENEQRAPVIWLRQSARFMLGEQRRTVEIAIPVRPGASAEEIERLLREADAGMTALTRHLDGRIADLLGRASANGANGINGAAKTAAPLPATASSPAQPATPPRDDTPAAPAQPAPTAAATSSPVHAAVHTAPSPAASTTHAAAPTIPTATSASSHSLPPRPTPAAAPATPSTRPATPAAAQPAARPAAAPPAASTEPLTRPEFLAETRTLGLTPPQVMQRLQVRSLDGLNYREALDLLRRQLLNESGAAPTVAPVVSPPVSPSMPAPAPASAPTPAPAYFDEEDDYDFTFTLPDDASASGDVYDDMSDGMDGEPDAALDGAGDLYDVDEIPDIADGTEPLASPSVPSTPSAAAPARAHELLEHFRGTTPGGAATPDQLKAYTNLIAGQLDATQAGTLVRGIWGVAPNRLGFDQLYALIQWGKEDAFAEEAPAVLAALKAEAARKASSATAASQSAPPARPTRTVRGARSSGGAGGDA